MENTNKKIIDTLNHLIAIAEDGRKGYETAAMDVEESTVKNYFQQFTRERAWYITQLKQQVNSLGGSAVESGGPLGTIHRTWIDVKAALTSRDTNAIINACITGEAAAVKNYKDALKEDYIRSSASVKDVLTEQLLGIENALNTIKTFVEKPVLK